MNEIIIVDKPEGYTSRDIVNIIGKKFKTNKVGHTGTLDPMATGVLVVCINKATKISELLTALDKEYVAEFTFGTLTDTLDIEGSIIKEEKAIINEEDIKNTLDSMLGFYEQEVPIYSAVKVNGKKLYEYARNNIEVELPKREIEVYDIELLSDIEKVDIYYEFSFRVIVSKGTYIRSLIRDIGIKLNTYACMTELSRTKQGNFSIDNSYTLNDIENDNYKLLKIKDVLDMEQILVEDKLLNKIKNGSILDKFFVDDKALILDNDGNEIGIYEVYDKDKSKAKPYKIF